ncbi:MAG: hypothetical protein OQL27_03025 [Sedimenticola sp.]|nr:hypothetical protein [Sedimenticola sp.]
MPANDGAKDAPHLRQALRAKMKIAKILLIGIVIVSCSYLSLWYGFAKGYEHKLSDNLAESVFTVRSLSLMREGKADEAIKSLEGQLDTQIVEKTVGDSTFVKYIVGLPKTSQQTISKLENLIIQYRKSTNYKCSSSEEVCEVINGFIYGNK